MTSPPSHEIGEWTRARILATTIELVARHGWGGVTTRRVAEHAKVNAAAVNYHFKTKADLLRAAAVQNMMQSLEGPSVAMLSAPRLVDGLRALLAWIAEVDVDTASMAMLFETMLQAPRDAELRRALEGALRQFRLMLAARITAEQTAGQVAATVEPAGAAAAIAAMLDGLLLHRIVDPALDLRRVGTALERLLEVHR